MAETTGRVGYDELATLKLLALDGALESRTTVTCSDLADRLDASNQTASRRLQRLEDADCLTRVLSGDGQQIALTEAGERALQREYEQYRRLFEGEVNVTMRGTVTSGMGEGRHYISLSGYMRQFRDRLGYEPFPGTLNVDLDEESVRTRTRMDTLDPVEIDGWETDERTYGPAFCWPATIETPGGERFADTHVIAPERTHHGADQLELIAPVKLRETLDLEEDDELTINVTEQ